LSPKKIEGPADEFEHVIAFDDDVVIITIYQCLALGLVLS
jgi:hypothetical protein